MITVDHGTIVSDRTWKIYNLNYYVNFILRALKFSLQDISRNIWLSIVTVTIIILAMLSINTLILTRVISSGAVEAIKEK